MIYSCHLWSQEKWPWTWIRLPAHGLSQRQGQLCGCRGSSPRQGMFSVEQLSRAGAPLLLIPVPGVRNPPTYRGSRGTSASGISSLAPWAGSQWRWSCSGAASWSVVGAALPPTRCCPGAHRGPPRWSRRPGRAGLAAGSRRRPGAAAGARAAAGRWRTAGDTLAQEGSLRRKHRGMKVSSGLTCLSNGSAGERRDTGTPYPALPFAFKGSQARIFPFRPVPSAKLHSFSWAGVP